jgi:hypothetical protein
MTSIASTHTGICQLCGKRHMLPSGKLAKHGYTVDYGYFSGTCPGSDELPWEVSKGEAEATIPSAIAQRDRLLADADAVSLTGNDDGTVWCELRRPVNGSRFKTKTAWEKVKLDAEKKWNVVAADGFKDQHGYYGDANEIVAQLQKRYADVVFRRRAEQAQQYIDWQMKRCAEWAPAELQLVEDEEAKKGFVIRYRDGSGYVTDVYGGSWNATAYKGELEKAKRYTERGAKQMVGKLRMWKKLEVVAL